MARTRVRTTIAIDRQLLKEVDGLVERGVAANRNMLLEQALHEYLARIARRELDEAFAGMAADPEYQAEARQIVAEFEAGEDAWNEKL